MIELKSARIENLNEKSYYEEILRCLFDKRSCFEDVVMTYKEYGFEDIFDIETVKIEHILYLNNDDYVFLSNNYYEDYSFNNTINGGTFDAGYGDFMTIYCKVINTETQDYFYFNNEGYLYLRYVGFKKDILESI